MDTSAAYATSFVEVAQWVGTDSTQMADGVLYNDLGDHNACLIEYAAKYDTVRTAICEGDFITFGGIDYSQAGNYNDTLSGAIACDSICLLYTSPSPRDLSTSRMPSSA